MHELGAHLLPGGASIDVDGVSIPTDLDLADAVDAQLDVGAQQLELVHDVAEVVATFGDVCGLRFNAQGVVMDVLVRNVAWLQAGDVLRRTDRRVIDITRVVLDVVRDGTPFRRRR